MAAKKRSKTTKKKTSSKKTTAPSKKTSKTPKKSSKKTARESSSKGAKKPRSRKKAETKRSAPSPGGSKKAKTSQKASSGKKSEGGEGEERIKESDKEKWKKENLEKLSKTQLYELAKELDIRGRSKMERKELLKAVIQTPKNRAKRKQVFTRRQRRRKFENLPPDIAKTHVLIPKHERLSKTAKKELLETLAITIREMPRISLMDPAIQHLDPRVGDIIKITRKSYTAGIAVYYRVVANV